MNRRAFFSTFAALGAGAVLKPTAPVSSFVVSTEHLQVGDRFAIDGTWNGRGPRRKEFRVIGRDPDGQLRVQC